LPLGAKISHRAVTKDLEERLQELLLVPGALCPDIGTKGPNIASWGKLQIHLCWLMKFPLLPSGKQTKLAIENGPVEIVDFPNFP